MGDWLFTAEAASLKTAGGTLLFRFIARDVNLVLGATAGTSVRFRVTLDGQPPGVNHGDDTNADGQGVLREHRLYQLLRQTSWETDRLITIEFLDPGVEAFAFTFG